MSIAYLQQAAVNTGSAVTTTSTFQPAGHVYFCAYAKHGTVDFTTGTALSGFGMTWAKVAEYIEVGGTHHILTCWVGYVAAPTSTTATMTFSQTPSGGSYILVASPDYLAADPTSGAVTNSGTATSGTVTLGALTANHFQIAIFGHAFNEVTTPPTTPTTWTEIADVAGATAMSLEIQVGAGAVGAAASWVTSSKWAGAAWEVNSNNSDVPDLQDDDWDSDGTGDASGRLAELMDEGGVDTAVWAILAGGD